MQSYDVLIIGAGAVGCAIAKKISSQRSDLNILVIDRNNVIGDENSKNNSGVIHPGLHLNPDFLKARFARFGGSKVVDFCLQNGVPCKKSGMYIVLTKGEMVHLASQIKSFWSLVRRAKKQGITLEIITGWEIKRRLEVIECAFGICIPDVYVIDPIQYVKTLHDVSKSNGVNYSLGDDFISAEMVDGRWNVKTSTNTYRVNVIINSAGIGAEKISHAMGINIPRVYYYRGEYFEVVSDKRRKLDTLVYPVVRPGSSGLGIHITKKMDGRLILGPNALPVYEANDFFREHTTADIFHSSVKEFYPELKLDDLQWSFSGIRTKLSPGKDEADFYIKVEQYSPTFVNLIGIESPGLTASISIGEYVYNLIRSHI